MVANRYLSAIVARDLKKKMVLLAGPRQVGKTTFAQTIAKSLNPGYSYFNWDNDQDRKSILAAQWPEKSNIILLDEIHKYHRWKRFVKGQHDVKKDSHRFFITGSARLDVYQKGGDSMMGRYHYHRLHPFSLAELAKLPNPMAMPSALKFQEHSYSKVMQGLWEFGGFPEPYLEADKTFLKRWQNERKKLMFREDVRDLTQIRNISIMQHLTDMLPEKIGSPLSPNTLKTDLEVTHKAVINWLKILESLFYCFRIYPYAHSHIKSLKKEAKLYLWDWSEIDNPAARLENLVASHLNKFCDYLYDSLGEAVKLYYLKDVAHHEVDFLVTLNQKPWFAVEVKTSDENIDRNLHYFKTRLNIPYIYQVVKNTQKDFIKDGIRVMPLEKFLTGLV